MSRPATLRDALTRQPLGTGPARVARAPVRGLLWLLLRAGLVVRLEGRGRPGPLVVVSNHPDVIDGLIVLLADPALRPVARWHRVALLRVGMWIADCLVTTTGTPVTPHRGAYAGALAHLRRGGRVWIAPEGGCQPLPQLRRPRTGAVRLAHAAGVPLQILAVVHDRRPGPTWSTWRPWHRPGVTLRWGPVLSTTGHVDTDSDRMMRALAVACGGRWHDAAPAAPAAG